MSTGPNLEDVRNILKNNREHLMREYNAVGVGIGKAQENEARYAIVVYVSSKGAVPSKQQSVENVPLQFTVTGNISLQSSSGGDPCNLIR
jgi:hypothetical protein